MWGCKLSSEEGLGWQRLAPSPRAPRPRHRARGPGRPQILIRPPLCVLPWAWLDDSLSLNYKSPPGEVGRAISHRKDRNYLPPTPASRYLAFPSKFLQDQCARPTRLTLQTRALPHAPTVAQRPIPAALGTLMTCHQPCHLNSLGAPGSLGWSQLWTVTRLGGGCPLGGLTQKKGEAKGQGKAAFAR